MRNVLITGGGRGIGRECVKYFTSKGDRVFFTYKSDDTSARKLANKTNAVMIKGNDNLKNIINQYGRLDILVNNAGIAQQKLFQDITDEDWDEMFNTNIRDMFRVTQMFYDDFIHNKSGKIVNVSSVWGIHGASCEVHYSASKAAVIGFTKALAREVGPSGINVNCVAPGLIDTDMNNNISYEDKLAFAGETALGRMGTAKEVAQVIGFLCSKEAAFITGQIISCDGGL